MSRKDVNQSKKILIVLISLRAEGTPVLVLKMCPLWLQKGVQPLIVTLNPEPNDLMREFQELGVDVTCMNLPTSGYGRYFRLVVNSYRICRQYRPHAVLSMFFGWHAFIALGTRMAGARTIVAHVGNFPPYWVGNSFKKFYWEVRLGSFVTHKLICCSNYIREGVIKHFRVKDFDTVMVYNGCPVLDIGHRADSVRENRENRIFTIGMVASLEASKDQATLIRAARILKGSNAAFKILLIGDGSCKDEYVEVAKQEGVTDSVEFMGTRKDIPELLGEMDVFVFSVKQDEGMGIALAEAMAAGVPVIATDVGACREVLDNGTLGILVPQKDPEKMAVAIKHMMDKAGSFKSMAQQAQTKALRDFDIEKTAFQYAKILGVTE